MEEKCWNKVAAQGQRRRGRGCVCVCERAESAGSPTNRHGSSVNGLNEEWEQTKCAEMKVKFDHTA